MKFSSIRDKVVPYINGARFAFFPLLICYLEIVLHYFAYRSFTKNTVWIILFSCGIGAFFTFLTCVFPKKVNLILTYVFAFIFTLLFEIQLIYFEIFKGFAPVSSVKLGAQAVTNFTGAMFEGIRSAIEWIIMLLLPLVIVTVLVVVFRPSFERPGKKLFLIPLALSVAILVGTVGTMSIFFSGTPSLYRTFSSSSTSTDTSVNYFGLNITMGQEFRWLLFPKSSTITAESLSNRKFEEGIQMDESIDFGALYEKAGDNTALKNLTTELSNMPTTEKNVYTGLCEGYNLISICAEAFSPEFIDPELTPTLYKLSNNGFIFDNFYATFPNTTTNGEYAFCMGLMPDLSREKVDSSFSLSASNYLPYCYGNLFKENGAQAYAYHNYVAEFYYRNYTHTNMGYKFTAANSGLDIEITWPSSDYDMMVASVDDYINSGEQFVAYYMTFSGHYQYTLDNAMSAKNWGSVTALPYSDAVKAYIACNLELEKALTYLMEQLEAAGIADHTMIVLTTDHYPYGLTDEEYSELSGREINDNFDKQKNSFICYIPDMEPIHVDSYCSTVDILPTILNLFGFTYDSRLLAGQDVLSPDAYHVAMLADGSFITDGIRYDASKLEYEFAEDNDETRAFAEEIYLLIEKRFRLSTEILNNDYYSFVFDRKSESEAINDLTDQYTDVTIMTQAPIYYVLKNDLMDPIDESTFGLYTKSTITETLDAIYRMADRPEIDADKVNAPYSAPEEYADAVAWAYENGILVEDRFFSADLDQPISVGQLSLLLYRTAEYYGIDVSVDEASFERATTIFPNIYEEIRIASVFCRDNNIIQGDNTENYIFHASTATVDRSFVAQAVYKICSYYIFPEES